jgi:hypothetical protein
MISRCRLAKASGDPTDMPSVTADAHNILPSPMDQARRTWKVSCNLPASIAHVSGPAARSLRPLKPPVRPRRILQARGFCAGSASTDGARSRGTCRARSRRSNATDPPKTRRQRRLSARLIDVSSGRAAAGPTGARHRPSRQRRRADEAQAFSPETCIPVQLCGRRVAMLNSCDRRSSQCDAAADGIRWASLVVDARRRINRGRPDPEAAI